MLSTGRTRTVVLAATLMFGIIATLSLPAPPPAHAQGLHIALMAIVINGTSGPITISDDGVDCLLVTPITNCGVELFGGPVSEAAMLFNLSLFTLDEHLQTTALSLHMPEDLPLCLGTLLGFQLFNLNGTNLFLLLLASLGLYSVTNCSLVVTAWFTLALGSSPSSRHAHAHIEVVHT